MADTSRSQLRKLKEEYARNPGSRVFVHLAEAHRKAGELKQAQQVLTEGLRRHGDYPSGLVVLARVLADQGEDERAAAVWRDVVRLDPENIVALRALGDIAEAAGRRVEAMQLYRRVVRLENGDPEDGESEIVSPDFDEEDAEPASAAEPAPLPPEPVPAWRLRRVDPPAPRAPEPAAPREPDPVPAWRTAEPPAPTPEPVREPEPTPAWRMREPDPIAPTPPPEPVREPEPEPAPAPLKSRFSWLVRTVTGGRVDEPQPEPPAPPRAREETVFEAPPAAPDPVPVEAAYVPPREELPETFAEYAPPEPIPPAEPVQVADPSELDADPAPLAAEPEPAAAEDEEAEPFEGVLDGIDAAALAPSAYVAERWAASTDNPEVEEAPAAEDAPIAYHAAPDTSLPDDEEEDDVAPGDIVVIEDVSDEEEADEAEAPVASIFDGADEDITRFVEAQAQNEPVLAEPLTEPEAEAFDEEPAGPVRFDELAKLAYTARPAPPPADPLAQIRAEMYGAPQAAAEVEMGAGAAGLAEVLVRVLEQQGGVMHAESSLRRLLALALAR
ncbi:MAG TPA: tetratricopeptide repeat protein, partial [Longimicrobium sp.]